MLVGLEGREGGRGRDEPVCDVWLDESEHLLSRLGDLDEHAAVDLDETKELKDLPWLGSDFVDTKKGDVRKVPTK